MSTDATPPPSSPASEGAGNGGAVVAMLAAGGAGDAGDREALAWVRGVPAEDAYEDADAVHPLSWWLAARPPPPSDAHRRELTAHGHPDGWLVSLRELYVGARLEPSFSATAMTILAQYSRVLDRPAWDLLATQVTADAANVAGYAVAAWLDAHPDGGDDVIPDDAGGGSAPTP